MTDVQAIVSQLTLEEKAALCTGASAWTTVPVERLNLPALLIADGPHGFQRVSDELAVARGSHGATCFPAASCLAATWNTDLLYEMGQALAEEAIALGVDIILGPSVNMKRSPLCGRNVECFSEDPHQAGALASSLVQGIQSRGVGASLKHFAANNQESKRFSIDAEVDERTLREIYLPAFETAVKQARPWAILCGYNRINGTYSSEHAQLLTDILKEEWGFAGIVFSERGAVQNRVAALRAGLDVAMPDHRQAPHNTVVEMVRDGALDESVLDEAARRIVRVMLLAAQTPKGGEFDAEAHHALARKVAAEGVVLLKNDGLLPLRHPRRIAVIGPAAQKSHSQGGVSLPISSTGIDVPFNELQELAANAELRYAAGYAENGNLQQALIDEAAAAARSADVALLFIALPMHKESEGHDRVDLDLTAQQVVLIHAVTAVQPNSVVILNNGAPVVVGDWIDGTAAVLEAGMMGQAGAEALADILFGRVNPSGKLAETFPFKLADTPAYLNFPGENGVVRYGERLFIGYRYYDTREVPVQFPFGHGLSYTTFAYSNARLSATRFKDVDGVAVSVDVTNTGPVVGKEVVQLYVHDKDARLVRPYKELKGFAKVELRPGETTTVTIPLDFRAFAYYDPAYRKWISEDGQFDILIGASATDIRCIITATLESTLQLPTTLHAQSTIRAWFDDPVGKTILEPILSKLTGEGGPFGDGGEDSATGQGIPAGLLDLTLRSFLKSREHSLTQPAEDVANMLLEQVYGAAS